MVTMAIIPAVKIKSFCVDRKRPSPDSPFNKGSIAFIIGTKPAMIRVPMAMSFTETPRVAWNACDNVNTPKPTTAIKPPRPSIFSIVIPVFSLAPSSTVFFIRTSLMSLSTAVFSAILAARPEVTERLVFEISSILVIDSLVSAAIYSIFDSKELVFIAWPISILSVFCFAI